MKQTHLLIICLGISLLTACQNVSPDNARQSADQLEKEKAQAVSKIKIEVTDDGRSEKAPLPVTPALQKKEITVSSTGLQPATMEAKVGQSLTIINSLDKQINLYTTADGAKSCEVLGSTIEIPGGQSKQISLEKPFRCTIINQENTDQKVDIKVE